MWLSFSTLPIGTSPSLTTRENMCRTNSLAKPLLWYSLLATCRWPISPDEYWIHQAIGLVVCPETLNNPALWQSRIIVLKKFFFPPGGSYSQYLLMNSARLSSNFLICNPSGHFLIYWMKILFHGIHMHVVYYDNYTLYWLYRMTGHPRSKTHLPKET